MNESIKTILVVDLETTSLNIDEALIRVFGAYDPNNDAWYIYRWNDDNIWKVMKLFAEYKTILTFNGTNYDLPILRRHGIPTDFRHIDIYQCYKRRGLLLRRGGFDSYSLKALTLQLKLDEVGKETIDYEIFKKETWTQLEQELIVKYLKQDLTSTWKLWSYITKKLEVLSKYLKPKDAENYKHLTTNLATYTYKVICNGAKIQELYDENPAEKNYPQMYTTTPRKPYVSDRIVLLQFKHLLPHTLIQFNMMSHNCRCCPGNEGKYHGRNIYTIKGYYCQKTQGRIERFLKQLLIDSTKNQDANLIKNIVFNHLYDVVTNGVYHSTYYPVAPNDAISLIKQMTKIIIDKFEAEGFYVIYIDNDDVFIQLKPGQTLEELEKAKNTIMTLLKSRMSYPSETFKLEFKEELSYIQFFNKGSEKNKVFMYKGQYVYLNNKGEVFSKGVTPTEISSAIQNRTQLLKGETV
jgi:DNA polymerase elongation subunit (family B)